MTKTINKLKTYLMLNRNYTILFKLFFTAMFCLIFSFNTYSIPSKFRLVGIGDLCTEMTLVFDTSFNGEYDSDTKPKVYYSTNYNAVNNLSSAFIVPTEVNTKGEMRNNICRFKNLNPNTTYYFKVVDNNGTSAVYNFETLPNDNSPLSIIAGGDSRNNRSARVTANKLVAKLKPHAVLFTGDFTDQGTPTQWQNWFEDWQHTIDKANRITPIIPTRGSHEANDSFIVELFGTPPKVYYTSTNGSLLSVITLNSEKAINAYGEQTTWLLNTLTQINTTYKIVQYHRPMRSHVKSKYESVAAYAYWAKLLEDYTVDLVVESDSHTSKTTWPIVVCTGGLNCDEGFKRDDINGVVYTGEGCWGSPLRNDDDRKLWTRSSGMFNQFKLILIDEFGMEHRTVLVDNEAQVTEVDINNRFNLPPNQSIWTTGEVVFIKNKKNSTFPSTTLAYPKDNTILYNLDPIFLEANASDANGNIQKVSFYINGNLINEDFTYPYQYQIHPISYGQYVVHVIATDNDGLTSCIDMATISLKNGTIFSNASKIKSTTDDAEEYATGYMDLFNWDMDLGYNNYKCGLRFLNVNIPPNAIITNAYIQFTADEVKTNPTLLIIHGEKKANANTFFIHNGDISNRIKTNQSVPWTVDAWTKVGDSGSAQRTPNLKNIMQEIIALDDYSLVSPFAFIIEGSGYRASEVFDGDSIKAAVLHYTYSIGDEPVSTQVEVWPGDANNDDIVTLKDVLYVCLSYDKMGPARINASNNWFAQLTKPWNSSIEAINFAHQDANGDGIIYIDDIDVVVQNYGYQTPDYQYYPNQQTNLLKLKQASITDKSTEYDLVLEANDEVMAHGIHGSIDLSDFLKNVEDKVIIDPTFNTFLGADVVKTIYHEDSKILDFALSRTDHQNKAIQNISLMRVIIIVEDIIDGGQPQKAIISSSGIVSSTGKYENLKGSAFYAYQEQIEGTKPNTYSAFNFNLITTKAECGQNGTAEVEIFNDNLSTYEFEWSNGASGYIVDNLEAGNYLLNIKKDNALIKTIDFEIESYQNVSEIVLIDDVFTKDTVVRASKEIEVNNGIELSNKHTTELLIEDCR